MESPLRRKVMDAEPPAGLPARNGRRYADTTSDLSLLMSSAIDSDGFYTQQQVISTLERMNQKEHMERATSMAVDDAIAARNHLIDRLCGREDAAIVIQRAWRKYRKNREQIQMRRVLSRCTSKLVAYHLPERCYSSRTRASVPLKSYAIQAAIEDAVVEEADGADGEEEAEEHAVQRSLNSSGEHAPMRSGGSLPGRHAFGSTYVYQHVLPSASPTASSPASPAPASPARPKLLPLAAHVTDALSSGASSMSAAGSGPSFTRSLSGRGSLSSRGRPLLPSLLAQPFPLPAGSPALQGVPAPLPLERTSWHGSALRDEASMGGTDSPIATSFSNSGWETPEKRTLPALSSPGQGAERGAHGRMDATAGLTGYLASPGRAPSPRARPPSPKSDLTGRSNGVSGWEQLQAMRRSGGGSGDGSLPGVSHPRMAAFQDSRGLRVLEQMADGLDTPFCASGAGPPSLGADLSTDMVGRFHSMPIGGDGARTRPHSMPGHSPLAGQASYVSTSGAASPSSLRQGSVSGCGSPPGPGGGAPRAPRRPSGSSLAPTRQSDPVGGWMAPGKPTSPLSPLKPPSPGGLPPAGKAGKPTDASKLFQEWREKKKKEGVALGEDGMPIVQEDGESFFTYVQRRMAGSPAGKR